MDLTNCEINLDLNWSKKSLIVVIDVTDQGTIFSIIETKLIFKL